MKDGGPAFPADVTVNRATGELQPRQLNSDDFKMPGMSLRDYAAIEMMAALVADAKRGPDTLYMNYEVAAQEAYKIADAMLKARNP